MYINILLVLILIIIITAVGSYIKSRIIFYFMQMKNDNLFKYPTKLRYKNENLVVISNKINIKFESI